MRHSRVTAGMLTMASAAIVLAGCGSGGGQGAGASSSAAPPSGGASSSAPASSSSSSSSSSAAPAQGQIDSILKKNPIHFALMKSTVDDKSKQTLQSVAGILGKSKQTKVKVTGYVVPHSLSDKQAKDLSTKRAEAVGAELTKAGVAKDRVSTEGGGEGKDGASAKITVAK